MVADLTLPGDFAFQTVSSTSMVPEDPSVVSGRRQALVRLGDVTINITWRTQNYYKKLGITQRYRAQF